jgi:amino acid adenylation domain-containing protein
MEPESIGVDDDFFHIGGHSLRATIMVSKIQAELGVRIPLAEVFKTPTIKGLARIVSVSDKEFYDSIRPADPQPYYPQSSAQKRMFFLDQFEEIGVSYNMPFVLEVPGQLDIPRFQRTLDTLIRRHETLRTSFGLEAGQPVQYIHEPDAIQFKIQEMVTNEPVSSPQAIRQLIDTFVRPFNLSSPPLLRAAAVRLPEGRNLLLFDIHHIIFDGSARGVLTEEFIRIHDGEELPPLRLHYKDFSVWQNRMFAGGRIRRQEHYWMDVFAGELPVLDLPTDFPRPPVFLFEGSNFDFQLDTADSEGFIKLCRERGATLFMGLMTLFNILLYKYSGQEDIVVGTGIAGRHHADLQQIVGMFVNSLALRTRPQPQKTFLGLLGEVREHALQAYENQDVQFEDLVDKLNLPRDPSRNPLFSATLVLQNFERSDSKLEGAEVSRFEYENRASKVDLALFAQEGEGQLYFSFEYCARLFTPATIERMAKAFENVVKQALERPDATIRAFDCVSPEERERLTLELNAENTGFSNDLTLPRLWRERVEKSPLNIAILDDRLQSTYAEVEAESLRIARYLKRNGVGNGMPVGILLDSSTQVAAAMLAVSYAGGAYVPLDPAAPEGRLRVMINDAAIGIVISQKRWIRLLNRLQWDCTGFHTFLCLDSPDVGAEREKELSDMMDQKLWHFIAEQGDDDISAGGWVSSYTGRPLSPLEMEEFGDNAFKKLRPLLKPETRVLEIGCASGFTMYRVAPLVKRYLGTDLSSVIIQRNRERVRREGAHNIELQCLAAHELDRLQGQTFDLVIINSVIQSFHGHNYLRQVLKKTLQLLDRQGTIFVGDVMDQDLKNQLRSDLLAYRQLHGHEPGIKTKTDLSQELFISREFWRDWRATEQAVQDIQCSNKIHTVENELTRFRYDALITVDKDKPLENRAPGRRKHQHDLRELEGENHNVDLPEVSPSQPAYMIFTSGTTGVPKGIVIRHQNIVNYCLWRREFYGFTEEDCALQLISPVFDGFASNLYPPLFAGGKVVMVRRDMRLDYNFIAGEIQRRRVTHFSVVPAMYRELLECAAPEQLASVRLAVLAAEGAGEELLRIHEATAPHITLANEYGPTENAVATTAFMGTTRRNLGIIGKPVTHNHCLVLAADLSLLPVGVPGELAVLGRSLSSGYLNRPELTADYFVPCPLAPHRTMYRTGDRVRRLDNGDLEFLGRVDSQIKIRGFRVELDGIQKQLQAHPNVRDAVVVTVGSGESPALAAYVESSETSLKDYLAGFFPDYMIPSYIVPVETLPRTATGKIDRKALPEPGAKIAAVEEVAPGSPEERMRGVWAAVLGIDPPAISVQTNFFDLGGNSLKATALQRSIQGEFAVKIPLADIFKTPFIEELIQFIQQEEAGDEENHDPQLECLKRQRHGSGNLFLIHAGSGEVNGYAEFCGHLAPAFTCWGIKGAKPNALAPFNTTIEALARSYVDKILAVQPQGPYHLFGWCIGGTIAYEMARQLEQMGQAVAMVAIVNARPPDPEAAESVSPFTMEGELEWLQQAVPHIALAKRIKEVNEIEELWKEVASAVGRQADGVALLKQKIPPSLGRAIPNIDTLECEPLLDYFNLGRSLSQARLLYVPDGHVEAPVSFFQAQDGHPAPWEGWQPHCRKPLRLFEVRGDHFSVFTQPYVEEFSRLFGKLLR